MSSNLTQARTRYFKLKSWWTLFSILEDCTIHIWIFDIGLVDQILILVLTGHCQIVSDSVVTKSHEGTQVTSSLTCPRGREKK
jgi:hypothetical protein